MDPKTFAGSEPLWTALDVARYLNVSRATIYNLARHGALPVVRIGALLRFAPDAVRKMERSAVVPAPVVRLQKNH